MKDAWPKILGSLLMASGFLLGLSLFLKSDPVHPYHSICELVSQKIYLDEESLAPWREECHRRAGHYAAQSSTKEWIEDLRGLFGLLNMSHLEIYDPEEAKKIWTGEQLSTGIESEFVDGELLVFEVHANSAAAKAGVQRGDLIQKIQDQHPAPWLARTWGGEYLLRRRGRDVKVNITPTALAVDESPRWSGLNRETALVRVPSFRSEFFEAEAWKSFVEGLKPYKRLILDLRGNSGGNFVAGLRFLSPFMCAEQNIGYLVKPKVQQFRESHFSDDLDDSKQLEVIDNSDLVGLQTYPDYGCLTARVLLLVDSKTASAAEMVTQALRDYLDAKVWGVSTAGQLLVGVWYPLPEVGEGWKISIPEAVYQSRRGQRIEGRGVRVDRELYYNLKDFEKGRDTWIEAGLHEH